VAQLQADRSMRSVGARTGLLTEPMLCFDFDGATASLELDLDPGWVSSCWAIAVGIAVSVLTELHVTGPCHSFSLLQRCRIRRSKASGDVRALVMNRWHAALRVPLRGD
jgi:hypothetical protein